MDKIHLYFNKSLNLKRIKKEIFHKSLYIKYIGKITDYYISKVQPLLKTCINIIKVKRFLKYYYI